jgi:hypothetical protein
MRQIKKIENSSSSYMICKWFKLIRAIYRFDQVGIYLRKILMFTCRSLRNAYDFKMIEKRIESRIKLKDPCFNMKKAKQAFKKYIKEIELNKDPENPYYCDFMQQENRACESCFHCKYRKWDSNMGLPICTIKYKF